MAEIENEDGREEIMVWNKTGERLQDQYHQNFCLCQYEEQTTSQPI
jgi:hypothetical protein